jgi:hypothetical protein
MTRTEALASLSRFRRVVLWGLRSLRYTKNTMRYVFESFDATLRKIDKPVVWVDDAQRNQAVVGPGDLVLSTDVNGNPGTEWLPRVDGAYYCLHNFANATSPAMKALPATLDPRRHLHLQIYARLPAYADDICRAEHWDPITALSRTTRTLYQDWGTDLLEDEFCAPVSARRLPVVFYVGTPYQIEVQQLRKAIRRRGIAFVRLAFIPARVNRFVIRMSAIAPSVAARIHVDAGYLPCRLFKNISYGQLGISNVPWSRELFGDSIVFESDVDRLVELALAIPEAERIERIRTQQRRISRQTYADKLANIARAFDLIA